MKLVIYSQCLLDEYPAFGEATKRPPPAESTFIMSMNNIDNPVFSPAK